MGGGFQGEEADEGKLYSIRGYSGGVVLEGTHGEAAWKNSTVYKGGGGGGVGVSYLCGILPLGAEYVKMPDASLPVSSL